MIPIGRVFYVLILAVLDLIGIAILVECVKERIYTVAVACFLLCLIIFAGMFV